MGTVIRIEVSSLVRRRLLEDAFISVPAKCDWFVYDLPTVAHVFGTSEKVIQAYKVRRPSPENPGIFRMLRDQKDGYDVFWTYAPMPNLSVNGMFVTNSSTRHKFGRRGRRHWSQGQQTATDFKCAWAKFSIGHPKLCISDPDGRFPLNLQRTNISEPSYPFLDQLLTDVVDDYQPTR